MRRSSCSGASPPTPAGGWGGPAVPPPGMYPPSLVSIVGNPAQTYNQAHRYYVLFCVHALKPSKYTKQSLFSSFDFVPRKKYNFNSKWHKPF